MYTKRRVNTDFVLIILIILLGIISLISINSAEALLGSRADNYTLKQATWYVIGFISIIIISFIGNKNILKYSKYLYIAGVASLVLVLFFGKTVNNSRCWFEIPYIGAFQPSEFMKIILILTLSNMIDKFHDSHPLPTVKQELVFIIKVLGIVAIPSILTFLQPDTGIVLIYLIITFVMLFLSGIRYRWFIMVIGGIALIVGSILGIYFLSKDLFISFFGTSFFLRIDRLLDWSTGSGYQLENGITAIGSGGLLGFGINKTPIYFPEPQTDFIFAVFASNFGFIGSLVLLLLLLILDLRLLHRALKAINSVEKYIVGGCIGMLLYQQIQNIGMTYGLLPITGITLPFISYGGSSLISYLIIIGIILNIKTDDKLHLNK